MVGRSAPVLVISQQHPQVVWFCLDESVCGGKYDYNGGSSSSSKVGIPQCSIVVPHVDESSIIELLFPLTHITVLPHLHQT